jgi:hypothetical protein
LCPILPSNPFRNQGNSWIFFPTTLARTMSCVYTIFLISSGFYPICKVSYCCNCTACLRLLSMRDISVIPSLRKITYYVRDLHYLWCNSCSHSRCYGRANSAATPTAKWMLKWKNLLRSTNSKLPSQIRVNLFYYFFIFEFTIF